MVPPDDPNTEVIDDDAAALEAGDEPTVTTPPFDWSMKLPEDLPPGIKSLKGKTLQDMLDSHTAVRREHARLVNENKAFKEQIEGKKPPPEGDPPPAAQTQDWVDATAQYLVNGEIPEADAERLSQTTGIPPHHVVRFMQYMKDEQAEFIGKAQEVLAEAKVDLDASELMDWMVTDDSPFSREDLAAFNTFSVRGDAHWIGMVADEFKKWHESGGAKPKGGKGSFNYAPPKPTRRGRPLQHAEKQGYKSRAEYNEAYSAAQTGDSQVERDAVKAKLAQSDIESWG